MRKYPKIKYPEDTSGLFADGVVYIQEKLDGANGRFTLEHNIEEKYSTEDRELVFGSRNQVYKNQKDESGQFRECINHVKQNININVLRGYDDKHNGITLFGEYMIPHTIREGYNWDKWEDKFIGFDIWSNKRSEFLNLEDSERIFHEIGLPFTQVLNSYTVDEWSEGDTVFHDEDGNWLQDGDWCPQSGFGDGLAEGIVIKNPTTQSYAKMVREDFREKHKTGDMKKSESGAEKLSYQYIPDARIEKTAYKLVDEGEWNELDIKMMQDLPKAVIEDMVEEEGYNIFVNESWEIDLSKFRSVTSDRCSRVLRQLIKIEA